MDLTVEQRSQLLTVLYRENAIIAEEDVPLVAELVEEWVKEQL